MDKAALGVLIKVVDLDLCRSFYKNVLELGEPVADSSFGCEFLLGREGCLILEKVEERALSPAYRSEGILWVLRSVSAKKLEQNLERYGYKKEMTPTLRWGALFCRYKDPEGNPFLVSPK